MGMVIAESRDKYGTVCVKCL